MKHIKSFCIDFVNTLIYFAFQAAVIVVEICHQIVGSSVKFSTHVLKPMLTELMADMHFVMLCFMQMLYEMTSTICLWLSKGLLQVSQHCHDKSEQLIERTWPQ